MKIKRLTLTNFRIFEQATFDFQPDMNLIVGVNGSGKSSVLDALRVLFSRALPRFSASKSKPQSFKADDVKAGCMALAAEIQFVAGDIPFTHTVEHRGTIRATSKQLREELKPNAEGILNSVKQSMEQPLAVYFSTQRSFPIMKTPSKQSSAKGQAAAFASALLRRGLRLREFAEWWLVQQVFSRRDDPDSRRRKRLLTVLSSAIHQFLEDYTHIKVVSDDCKTPMFRPSRIDENQIPESRLAPRVIDHNDRRISTEAIGPLTIELFDRNRAQITAQRLSDGERDLLALVFDLARRLSLANPELDDPLRDGKAVVLIDELDLHLHPSWQRTVIEKLTTTFPNCQFIATTHSPQIIGEVSPDKIILLESGQPPYRPNQSLGMDSNWILRYLMDADERDSDTKQKLSRIEDLIDEEQYDDATAEIDRLRSTLDEFPELVRLQTRIDRIRLLEE